MQEIKRIDKEGEWIMEGTYRESYSCLLDMADQIIFLDTPLLVRISRIITRFIKQQLHIEKCHYKSDLNMLKLMFKWTIDFEMDRKRFENMLGTYNDKLIKMRK